MPAQFHDGKKGTAIAVRVIPRAKKNQICEILSDGTVKIRIAAPPIEGKANVVLIKYLADFLEISPSNIEIIAGEKGRNKLVTIYDLDAKIVQEKINRAVGSF